MYNLVVKCCMPYVLPGTTCLEVCVCSLSVLSDLEHTRVCLCLTLVCLCVCTCAVCVCLRVCTGTEAAVLSLTFPH